MNKIKEFYLSNKAYFDHMSKTHGDEYFDSVLRFIKGSQIKLKKKKILDVGCGSGSLVKVLKKIESNFEAHGVDISKLGNPQRVMKFKQVDATDLPYVDNLFDMVFLIDVLEHVISPKKVLTEALRVLKKEGLLMIRSPNIMSPLIKKTDFKEFLRHKLFKRLKPNLSPDVIGGDQDAVSGIYFDKLLKELKNRNMKIIKWETWAGGPKNIKAVRILNYLPLLNLIGASATILAQKGSL